MAGLVESASAGRIIFTMTQNPLLDFSDLPLFDQIRPEHVAPAVDTLLQESNAALERVVRRAEDLARLAPENPEFMPAVEKQTYTPSATFSESTAAITPEAGPDITVFTASRETMPALTMPPLPFITRSSRP